MTTQFAARKTALNLLFASLTVFILFGMFKQIPAQKSRKPAEKPAKTAKTIEDKQPGKVREFSDISYTISMSKPATHLLEVEMRIKPKPQRDLLELKMPVWTPGSYLIREYARHVQDFEAGTASGNSLKWEKTSKNTWAVETGRSEEIIVRYKVYSNELTVRTNELNDEHAFWNNAALLLYPKGELSAPSMVTVVPFGNWRVATGLKPVSDRPNTFFAENYDILYDSPFEVSDYKEIKFDVSGKEHRFVVSGDGNYDLKAIARDSAKIIQQAQAIFGELPYDNYTFILNLRGGGGLEHLNSTALQWNRFGFKPLARYKQFLRLVAHEYFHLWNVKRIRPDALGPFDYENENYTKLLWVAEGATAYYEGVLLRRAGLITEREFLDSFAGIMTSLAATPGRKQTSLEEASFDAWIKYYRQDENSVNNQISYYDKGELVNMLLDVKIRTASAGQRSLDDVMRYLYSEFYKKQKNYTPQDYQKAAEIAAGVSLEDFFRRYVRGREDIDYDSILTGLGLAAEASKPGRNRAYLGADLTEDSGRLTIRSIPAGSPAYEQGLNTGDQIIAIDGWRASLQFLNSYIAEKQPGDRVRLQLFRFDKLREFEIELGADDRVTYSIVKIENPSDEQNRLYSDYVRQQAGR